MGIYDCLVVVAFISGLIITNIVNNRFYRRSLAYLAVSRDCPDCVPAELKKVKGGYTLQWGERFYQINLKNMDFRATPYCSVECEKYRREAS